MEHIHNCETPFYSDCPACRVEKAAPDLLEACKRIDSLAFMASSSLEACAYQGVPSKKWIREQAPAIDARKKALEECGLIVRAAIAKAENP